MKKIFMEVSDDETTDAKEVKVELEEEDFTEFVKATVCGYFAVAAVMSGLSSDSALTVFRKLELLVEEYTTADAAEFYYFFIGENPELEAYMKAELSKAKGSQS